MKRFALIVAILGATAGTAIAASGTSVNTANVRKQTYSNVVRPQGLCHMVDNAQSNSKAQGIFVPFNTPQEWSAFVNRKPSGITVAACCEAASFQVCDQTINVPVTRTGQSVDSSVQLRIREGQRYRISCQNRRSGVWQTLDGVGGSDNVVVARSPSNVGSWVAKFEIDNWAANVGVRFQCSNHSWHMTEGPSSCDASPPPSSMRTVSTINCFPDFANPFVAGNSDPNEVWAASQATYNSLCRSQAWRGGPHQDDRLPGNPWIYPSNSFNNSWGRDVLSCLPPSPI